MYCFFQPHISYYHVTKFIRSQFDNNVKVPAPPTTPVPQPVTLRQIVEDQYRNPRYVDEVSVNNLKTPNLVIPCQLRPFWDTSVQTFNFWLSVQGRLQGLKRVTLGLMQKSDPIEATAMNLIYLSMTDNIERPGTDTYNTGKFTSRHAEAGNSSLF